VLPGQQQGPSLTPSQQAGQVVTTYGPALVARVIGDGPGASQAQNAVATALMMAAGLRVAPGTPAYAAAERFSARPAVVRYAWLIRHLAALRAGQLTLAQLP
jgi:hypothetical protein